MRVGVDSIGQLGRTLEFGLADAWALTAASGALEAQPTELHGRLIFSDHGSHVAVRVEGRSSVPATCVRCGTDFDLVVDVETELIYVPEKSNVSEEVELSDSDLEFGWYADGVLHADAIVSEAFALSLPARIVCTDVGGCDARTAALLAERGSAGENSNAFTVLKGLSL